MIDPLKQRFAALSGEQKRTAVLAVVAGVLVLAFAVDSLLSGAPKPGTTGGTAGETAAEAPLAPGAPIHLGRKELKKRYAPVLDAALFEVRSFRPQPKKRKRAEAVDRPSKRDDPPPPSTISLRLTSLLGSGESRHGVLEEGGTGRGLIAKAGGTWGETSIAQVQTSSLLVTVDGKERSVGLGESLTLPASFRGSLTELRPPAPKGLVKKKSYSSSYTPKVELTEEKKMSLLEKLKAARRKSMKKKEASDEKN